MNAASIDFTGHESEMAFLAKQEAEVLASKEYLGSLQSELAEQQQRLADGFEKEQSEDVFGGLFQQTEAQWVEARQDRISQLQRAIARHPLA